MNPSGILLLLLAIKVLVVANSSSQISLSPDASEVVHYINDSHIVICNFPENIKVKWKSPHDDAVSGSKGRVHVESKSPGQLALVFEHISDEDKGTWHCVSENGERKSFKMLINKPILFMDTSVVQAYPEGKDVTVRCEVKGDPEPSISWSYNGQPITFPNEKYGKLADGLYIKSLSKNDAGEYTCKAFQVSDTINDAKQRTILLKIEHAPILPPYDSKRDKIEYGYVGGVVNLTCNAIAEPHANFTWIRHNKKLNPHTHSIYHGNHSSVLQIVVSDEKAFGTYKCRAENSYGSLERQISLNRGKKPTPPPHVSLRGVNSDTFDIDVGAVRTSNIRDPMDINGYRFELIPEELYREKNNWDEAKVLEFGFEDGVTFLINNLTPNTTYLVRVASKNVAGLSDWTEVTKLTTYPKEPTMISSNSINQGLRISTNINIIFCCYLGQYYLSQIFFDKIILHIR